MNDNSHLFLTQLGVLLLQILKQRDIYDRHNRRILSQQY